MSYNDFFSLKLVNELFVFFGNISVKLCILDLLLGNNLKICINIFFFIIVKIVNLLFIEVCVFVFELRIEKFFFDNELLLNYRFIFNLRFIFKVIEKVVVD